MKKILLTLSYPFWLFLTKTWIGNIMMIPIVIGLPMLPFYNVLNTTGEEAESIGILFAILDMFLLAPIVGGLFIVLSSTMEEEYERKNWLTQI
jgi:hypothetical protein